ncbi:DUF2911 domain-containing protein [Dokdonia sp. Hel_I_53]|uniref:DUF2911 domain-containing protein n=1 Tax=Dokdonia sp. Hel_I_53 TaxID=1566287 RepID=UPI0011990B34|nr:DUF2911 domain-containing protein [Dokdonia sp. Hel_I_53]TVZ51793.1 Protein of unknown function (DUF2911) [Dokdonia sp. Hel_I_53]
MKKFLLVAFLGVFTLTVTSQIETPAPSPAAKIMQKVGLTDVTVEYSRPAMRDRTIMGDLVPYGAMWRTGANANTTIEFSTPVTIGGKEIKSGKYAIYTKPMENEWEVYLYTDTNNWGTPAKWDDSKVAVVTKAKVQMTNIPAESFTVGVDHLSNDGAHLTMQWDKTYVAVPFEVPANQTVLASIDRVLSGPSMGDYYNAAVYLSSTDQDLERASKYMEKAMSMNKEPKFWQLRQQSLLLAKAGDKKGAIKAAQASLAGAKKAGNMDYIKMNNDSLKEWGAM